MSVLMACSEAPALLTLPRGRPDARGKNCLRTMARSLPFLRSWLWGWSVDVGAVIDSIFVCGVYVSGRVRGRCGNVGEEFCAVGVDLVQVNTFLGLISRSMML